MDGVVDRLPVAAGEPADTGAGPIDDELRRHALGAVGVDAGCVLVEGMGAVEDDAVGAGAELRGDGRGFGGSGGAEGVGVRGGRDSEEEGCKEEAEV